MNQEDSHVGRRALPENQRSADPYGSKSTDPSGAIGRVCGLWLVRYALCRYALWRYGVMALWRYALCVMRYAPPAPPCVRSVSRPRGRARDPFGFAALLRRVLSLHDASAPSARLEFGMLD